MHNVRHCWHSTAPEDEEACRATCTHAHADGADLLRLCLWIATVIHTYILTTNKLDPTCLACWCYGDAEAAAALYVYARGKCTCHAARTLPLTAAQSARDLFALTFSMVSLASTNIKKDPAFPSAPVLLCRCHPSTLELCQALDADTCGVCNP